MNTTYGKLKIVGFISKNKKSLLERNDLTDHKKNSALKFVGIDNVYHVDNNQSIVDMIHPLVESLDEEEIKRVDAVILVTQTPFFFQPSTSALIHNLFNFNRNAIFFDINHGCSGYIYGLYVATTLLCYHGFRSVVLITADVMSRILNPSDSASRIIFSDAASLTLIENTKREKCLQFDFDFLSRTDMLYNIYHLSPFYSKTYFPDDFDINEYFNMNGIKVFEFAARDVSGFVINYLEKNKLNKEKIELFLFHQANKLIVDAVQRNVGIDPFKVYTASLRKYGNTSSSSIPLALIDYLSLNPVPRKFMMVGFGVGLSAGICYVEHDGDAKISVELVS